MKIAINGFGRIGRLTLRYLLEHPEAEVVAINDLTDASTLAHLFQYDSVHGKYPEEVKVENSELVIGKHKIKILSSAKPETLPWKELNVEYVIECTGVFRNREKAGLHLQAGAKHVVISAPAQGDIPTVVLGVNDHILNDLPDIISNASCTTNCLAPMADVLNKKFEITKGFITTIHAYTADQRLQDSPHSDLRRARAAALSIIPTSTGAASAVGKVIPELKGKLDGLAMRVPVPTGSITDLVAHVSKPVTVEEVNKAIKEAAASELKGVLFYTDAPIVSADIVGDRHSCIFDSELTKVQGDMVKLFGWYDNEAGYAARLVDVIARMNGIKMAKHFSNNGSQTKRVLK